MSIWHRSCPTVKVFCVFLSIIPINHHYLTGFCGELRSETKYNVSGTIGIFDYVSRSAFDGARGTLFGISECDVGVPCVLNGVYFVNHSQCSLIFCMLLGHTLARTPTLMWFGDMETFADDGFLKAAPLKRKEKQWHYHLFYLLLVWTGLGGKNQTKCCFLRRTPLTRDISQRMWTNYQGEVEVAPLKIVVKSKYIPYRHFITVRHPNQRLLKFNCDEKQIFKSHQKRVVSSNNQVIFSIYLRLLLNVAFACQIQIDRWFCQIKFTCPPCTIIAAI